MGIITVSLIPVKQIDFVDKLIVLEFDNAMPSEPAKRVGGISVFLFLLRVYVSSCCLSSFMCLFSCSCVSIVVWFPSSLQLYVFLHIPFCYLSIYLSI